MKEPNLKACSLLGSSSGETGIKLGATVLPFTVGLANRARHPEQRRMIKVRNKPRVQLEIRWLEE